VGKAAVETERLNLYLPKPLVDDLHRYVPARQRTRFVSEAVARELRRLKLRQALDAAAGAWRDEDHPELATGADIDRWLAEGRAALDWDRPEEPAHA
jgi:hypothetical protein